MVQFSMTKKQSKTVSIEVANDFSPFKFAGTFREYQQRVIDNSTKYLQTDRKIHIVAAPGSGKTILGLELMRMLAKPTLMLSPTIAIREQWKERFEEMFLPKDSGIKIDDVFSCTLKDPKLMTSITYQGLYTSYRKISPSDDTSSMAKSKKQNAKLKTNPDEENTAIGDDEIDEPQENYSGIDIIKIMKEKKISILILDEAHHLRAEWQKALYEFVERVEHSVTIIALTATPPYDCKRNEWDKYIAMCGPIDEEIFVPELIRVKNLCPHQDFIYYNFPTESETELIEKYQKNVEEAMDEVFLKREILQIIQNAPFYKEVKEHEDELSNMPEFVKAMLAFLDQSGETANKQIRSVLEKDDRKLEWGLDVAEVFFTGIIKDDHLFATKDRQFVKNFFSKHGLVEKNEVKLTTCTELEKLLFTSLGKLHSIDKIVEQEWKNLGNKLRMLILTDYIRVNSKVLGTEHEIKEIGVIPIFEMLRRKNIQGLKPSVVSGKIIAVPNDSLTQIKEIASKEKAGLKTVPIKGTEFCELKFEGGSNSIKIAVITKAFNAGIVNCIIGTKSLLGEGWDSPVINSLILASFVGSFMLSNQMHGRAIRIDKDVPDKVSNIWHLTAILPEHLRPEVAAQNTPPSDDYKMLERRFNGFLGLSYFADAIISGLNRVNTLKPPYDQNNVSKANENSFSIAADRSTTYTRWFTALAKSGNEVLLQNEIPKLKQGFFPSFIFRPTHFSTIKRIAHATIKTFKELEIINKKAKAIVEKDPRLKTVSVGISRSSKYEKSLFHQAISEVLGTIDNPKYILIKTREGDAKIDYRAAFAVPEVFSGKKENADVFKTKMHKRLMDLQLYFTRNAEGQQHLAMVKKKAYVNKHCAELSAKMKMKNA